MDNWRVNAGANFVISRSEQAAYLLTKIRLPKHLVFTLHLFQSSKCVCDHKSVKSAAKYANYCQHQSQEDFLLYDILLTFGEYFISLLANFSLYSAVFLHFLTFARYLNGTGKKRRISLTRIRYMMDYYLSR